MRQLGAQTTCKPPSFWTFLEAAAIGNAVAVGGAYATRALMKGSEEQTRRTAGRVVSILGFWIGASAAWALLNRDACPSP